MIESGRTKIRPDSFALGVYIGAQVRYIMAFNSAPWHDTEGTRTLTMGERALFAAGAPMTITVVLTHAGYRALITS